MNEATRSGFLSADQLAEFAAEIYTVLRQPGGMDYFRSMSREAGEHEQNEHEELLPLNQRAWNFPEKAAILTAVFDKYGKGEPINPFKDLRKEIGDKLPSTVPGVRAFFVYDALRRSLAIDEATGLSRLPVADLPYLRAMLDDVRAALEKHSPSTGTVGTPVSNGDPSPHPDGPESPHWMWLNGTRSKIESRRSFQLLTMFWPQKKECATCSELDEIWTSPVQDGAYRTAATRFKADMPPGFPFTLHWDSVNRLLYKNFAGELHQNYTA